MADLTAFQFDVLSVLRKEEETHGLGIKKQLEEHFPTYNRDVNHGRLYPNLDELVDRGLVAKGKIDDRTNSYELTEEGERVLQYRVSVLEGVYGDPE